MVGGSNVSDYIDERKHRSTAEYACTTALFCDWQGTLADDVIVGWKVIEDTHIIRQTANTHSLSVLLILAACGSGEARTAY